MFIVLEGLDGAGKSTQIKLLREMFAQNSLESEYLHFPRFDAPLYGELIAKFLRGELGDLETVNPYLVAMLYAGDRADASSIINSWLSSGKVVIVDRYVYSNIAYQCAKESGDYNTLREWILDMEYQHFKIPKPDISLFLDVPFAFTEKSLSQERDGDDRSYLNGAKDIHESSLDLQRRVRSVYIDSASKDENFSVVDCSAEDGSMASPEVIFSRIKSHITPLI
ncbi:MAG: dTMP kinase, partial [Rikenellaceae bacterium]